MILKKTVETFREYKRKGEKIAMITAYDYSTAKLADSCGVDSILVGDSLGMVCLGYKDTLSVTMEDMLHHVKAVSRAKPDALVVADMPFLSYHVTVEEAVRNAGRFIQEGGADAVKLEGASNIKKQIKSILKAQIPVVGHIGLTPQSVNVFGGFKVQGKDIKTAQKIIDDAKILEDCGAFSIVLECIPEELARRITHEVSVPTIGIGAGKYCDGQVLVFHDMLGMYSEFRPKFVKLFADAGNVMKHGISAYVDEVKKGLFPAVEHSFGASAELIQGLYGGVNNESS